MEFFHVLNRGLNKQNVFLDDGDRMRFVQSLYVFNDSNHVPNGVTQQKMWKDLRRKRDNLIKLHAWCLMDNHYHLLLSPVNDDISNISLFAKKLNGGYAKFFNEKHERSGYLWQGKYKKIRMERDSQFMYIPYYIHLNPLDFEFNEWRNGSLERLGEAITFLDEYRWSSWQDYTGVNNFPSILHKNVLGDILGSRESQIGTIRGIVHDELAASNAQVIET